MSDLPAENASSCTSDYKTKYQQALQDKARFTLMLKNQQEQSFQYSREILALKQTVLELRTQLISPAISPVAKEPEEYFKDTLDTHEYFNAEDDDNPEDKDDKSYTTRAKRFSTTAANTRPSPRPKKVIPVPPAVIQPRLVPSSTDKAWTDIIRTRYPYFQRSTVQTSKHAREFIQEFGVEFVRVKPRHCLGRSKPTYAIPECLEDTFMQYFEKKFGSCANVLGRRSKDEDVNDAENEPHDVMDPESPVDRLDSDVENRNEDLYSEVPEKKIKLDVGADPQVIVSTPSRILYTTIINNMMPDFAALPADAHSAVRNGVKQFLSLDLGAQFRDCIVEIDGEENYSIPEISVGRFVAWAHKELKRCFPNLLVMEEW